jgi:hypothetical protein
VGALPLGSLDCLLGTASVHHRALLDLRIRGPLDIEGGVLYKHFGFDSDIAVSYSSGPVYSAVTSGTFGNSWEFPLLAHLRIRVWRGKNGFLVAGPVFRHLTGVKESGVRKETPLYGPRQTIPYQTTSPPGMDRRTSIGAAVGGGMEFAAGHIVFRPGVRVTRWDTERTASIDSASRLVRTQAEVLLGIGYMTGGRGRPAALIPCCFEPGLLIGIPFSGRTELEFGPSYLTYNTTYDRPAHRFSGGALLDWRFHRRLSLEGSFVARPYGHHITRTYPNYTYTETLSGEAREVPLLVKVRPWKMLAAGVGPVVRRAGNTQVIIDGRPVNIFGSGESSLGWAISGGLEFVAGMVRLRPEVRAQWFNRPLFEGWEPAKTRNESILLVLGVSLRRRR